MSSNEYLLEMNNISKHFPGVQALDGVSFKLKKGQIFAIVGGGLFSHLKCNRSVDRG